MSSDVIIKVENIGKCYQIYDKPEDRLKQFIFPKIQWLLGIKPKSYFKEFWALKDVSFEVRKGSSLGIIGRNGSGKSTILQIICGLITPTTGFFEARGRIAALLELGSGFNPEFTGRENIYLNASLLGLTPDEISESIEDIILFADIGLHIDQPIKTYSSGMIVRLAFAVQAQVNPDILVIDEALAVGDSVFQNKCARRIRQLVENGTTLLFVSHEPSAVATFCENGVLLHGGQQIAVGPTKDVLELYLARNKQELYINGESLATEAPETSSFMDTQTNELGDGIGIAQLHNSEARIGTGLARIISVELVSQDGMRQMTSLKTSSLFRLRIKVQTKEFISAPVLCYRVDTLRGIQIAGSTSYHDNILLDGMEADKYFIIDINTNWPFRPDTYSLSLYLNDMPAGASPVVIDGLETAVHIKLSQSEEAPPLYMVETPRSWHVTSVSLNADERSVRRVEDGKAGGFEIEVNGQSFSAPEHWFWPEFAEGWEADTFSTFQRIIRHSSKVVDIGAWIGPTVIFAAALGARNIHAVEANPSTFLLLKDLVESSPALKDIVTSHNLCVADTDDELEFGNLDGSNATSSASSVRGSGFKVQGVRLYNFLLENSLLDADLIKVDIEGSEEQVTEDLIKISSRFSGAIVLSLHPPFWRRSNSVEKVCQALSLFTLLDSRWKPFPISELKKRCLDKSEAPHWGTSFGNFFEVVLLSNKGN